MCFGGGGSSQYNSYSSGDYDRWKAAFDQKAAIETALAKGEIDQATADARLGEGSTYTHTNVWGAPITTKTGTSELDSLANRVKQDPSGGMELREIMRQHDVDLGRIGIDKAFTSFDDDYYKGYQDDYAGFYNPQLDRQFGEVVDKTTSALAGRGMLESSVGANTYADLGRQQTEARTNIANEAVDASNKLRGTVENSKSSLYSLNEASANPQAVNAQAIGQASALVAPPTYDPLGQVFASALGSLSNYQSARQNSPTKTYSSPYSSGYGSGKVYN